MFNHVDAPLEFVAAVGIHTSARWHFGAGAKLLADDGRYQRLRRGLSRTSDLLFAETGRVACRSDWAARLRRRTQRVQRWEFSARPLPKGCIASNAEEHIGRLRCLEEEMELGAPTPYDAFKRRNRKVRDDLLKFVAAEQALGRIFICMVPRPRATRCCGIAISIPAGLSPQLSVIRKNGVAEA